MSNNIDYVYDRLEYLKATGKIESNVHRDKAKALRKKGKNSNAMRLEAQARAKEFFVNEIAELLPSLYDHLSEDYKDRMSDVIPF